MTGRKKLSDIFIDRKIQLRHRRDALIIEDQNNIIWLVGVTTSEETRIDDDTSGFVKITVEEVK